MADVLATALSPASEAAAPAAPDPIGPTLWRLAVDVRHPDAQIQTPQWLAQLADKPIPSGCFVSSGATVLPRPQPLVAPSRLARFTRQHLARERFSGEPDVGWLIDRLARMQAVQVVPLVRRRHWPHRLQVVKLADPAIGPLRDDLLEVDHQLGALFGARLRRLEAAGHPGALTDLLGRAAAGQPDDVPTIVLGNVASTALAPADRAAWNRWAARRAKADERPLMIAPVPARLLTLSPGEGFDVALLDESVHLRAARGSALRPTVSPGTLPNLPASAAVQAMLGLLAGVSWIEPGLLRRVRRLVGGLRIWGADVGAEIEFRHRPEVIDQGWACRVLPAHNDTVLRRVVALVGDPRRLAGALRQVRGWLCALSPLLQAEHAYTLARHLPAAVADLLPELESDIRNADALWAWYAESLRRDPLDRGMARYVDRLGQANADLIVHGPEQIQCAWALAQGTNLAERKLLPGLPAERLAWLLDRLLADRPPMALDFEGGPRAATIALVPADTASPAALLTGLRGLPSIEITPLRCAADGTDQADEGASRRVGASERIALAAPDSWRLQVGARRLVVEPFTPPPWADEVWRDGPDWFATLAADGRRLRWVPQRAFALAEGAAGQPEFTLPHGAWWDDSEYGALVGDGGPIRCPSWADAGHGVDPFGWWAAFTVNGVRQTMRFAAPGRFAMGSPLHEPERGDNERQHPVVLTRAFWIGDTACTQALWQAVSGANPSRFAEKADCPVERVSWGDIKSQFLAPLERIAPDLQLRLPTEAEWEYATRECGHALGSFHWGEGITPAQANYGGNHPLPGGTKWLYRERTVAVKTFEPNRLGLYQMAGNVYEWIEDGYGGYPESEVVDPLGPGASRRVLRGGSWISGARRCRSASRDARHPGYRDDRFGFRLARGLPDRQQARRAEPAEGIAGGPEVRRPGAGGACAWPRPGRKEGGR